MDAKTLIENYKRTCELILELELDMLRNNKDNRKQDVLKSANEYKYSLWEVIIRLCCDPYNE